MHPPNQKPTFVSLSFLQGLRWEGSVGRIGVWAPSSLLSGKILNPLLPENSMSRNTVHLTKGNSIPNVAVFVSNAGLGVLS